MGTQVDASTTRAGQLFSTTYFKIPDFQRDYSWTVEEEVSDFWKDLQDGIDSPPYFLGLLIVTDEDGSKTVVDGQQRIITLTLLANSIRRAAEARGKQLVADSMRDVFLYGLDYDTEKRAPRVNVTAARDRRTMHWLLANVAEEPVPLKANEELVAAQKYLDEQVEADLDEHDAAARLGKWARFITNGLTFAVFDHPDRNAAYKVYEVVNTRGKDLTPAELIKSYLIGSADSSGQDSIFSRWVALEEPFNELRAATQFTQFIRHVVTLRHGYVIPRDLYQVITKNYRGEDGVRSLLSELEDNSSLYLQMVDPSLDIDREDQVLRSFMILDALGLRTVRPIFLATYHARQSATGLSELLRVILPRMVAGSFGTGSIERRFADAAREIFRTGDWHPVIESLRELIPSQEEFSDRVRQRPFNKGVLAVLRSSILQATPLPALEGFVHQIRPRNAEDWDGFDDGEFKLLGTTIGNYIISTAERRPRGTNSLDAVRDRLIPTGVTGELVKPENFTTWSAEDVMDANVMLSSSATSIWYQAP